MCIVLFLALVKLMFFLRIFDSLSYLVTLLRSVINDLYIFMLFYFILLFMFSLILGVLGVNNFTRKPDKFDENKPYPGKEYRYLNRFIS